MIVCIDIETTGTDKYNDKIIEIALIKFDENNYKIIDTFTSLVNPGIAIPEIISNITNIFDNDVLYSPNIEDLKEKILNFIGNTPILGHNIDFDIGFLLVNGFEIGKNVKIDTFFLANFLNYDLNSLNLEVLCLNYKIKFEGAHRALNDAKATIFLYKKLIEKFNLLDIEDKKLLQYIFYLSNDKNIKYLEDKFFPLFSEIISFKDFEDIILKNIGKKINKNKFVFLPNIKYEELVNIFNIEGELEHRENQINMSNIVSEALNFKKKVLIEAPTGLGKSFAYLIPSIIYSVKNNKKIYISTKTKALQDQLFYNDLGFLIKKLGIPFSYSKIKGKKNYISLKGFFNYILLGNFEFEEVSLLIKITFWLIRTHSGELDELNFFPKEFLLIKDINGEGIDNLDNLYYSYEFINKAKEDIINTNITIINHSLLFSNLENENNIIINLKDIIIDEAHNIEDSVTDALKESYNYLNLKEFFDRCEKIFKIKKIKLTKFLKLKDELLSNMLIIDDFAISYLYEKISEDNIYKTLLLKEDFFIDKNIFKLNKNIKIQFIDIIDLLKIQKEYDFGKETNYLENIFNIIETFFSNSNNDTLIKILNYNEKTGISYIYTLQNPGNYLQLNLWSKLESCVLTSATLSIGGNFNYFKNILNLNDFEFFKLNSDFDYKKQATLFLINDLGNIKNNENTISDFLKDFYYVVGGNTLTLFTNFAMIKKVYTDNNLFLKDKGIDIFAQSIGGSKNKLLSLYKENPDKSILLGTDSFWEGIDIPGKDLKYLIIHKFPFCVPSDPIFQSRSKLFKDTFNEYAIPKAIIKLKQGFGRLIRSKTDKGVIILLDNRINTEWGKQFYEAFPRDINIKNTDKSQLLKILNENINT